MRRICVTVCAIVGLTSSALRAEPRRKSGSSSAKKSTAAETPRPKSDTGGLKPRSSPPPKPKATPAPEEDAPAPPKPRSTKKADAQPASTLAPTPPPSREHAPAATLDPQSLAEFSAQPARVQDLLGKALDLTKLDLTYTYGSSNPAQGGMDCSGTIYHLLSTNGFKNVPRDSSAQYAWVRRAGKFFSVVSRRADSFEFSDLQPGDLMFWTGTYQTGRDIPISHVMLYLGVEKKRKQRVMFGASDGRSYDGVQRWGVSVFDFKMPRVEEGDAVPAKPGPVFVGYGRIPGLREVVEAETKPVADIPQPSESAAQSTPAPKRKKRSTAKRE